jgi:hypothetical protein
MGKVDINAELLKAMMATPEGKPVNTLEQAMAKKPMTTLSTVYPPPPPPPPVHGSKAMLKIGDVLLLENAKNEIITLPQQHCEPHVLGRAGDEKHIAGLSACEPNPCKEVEVLSPEKAIRRDPEEVFKRYAPMFSTSHHLFDQIVSAFQKQQEMQTAAIRELMQGYCFPQAKPEFLADVRLTEINLHRDHVWSGDRLNGAVPRAQVTIFVTC